MESTDRVVPSAETEGPLIPFSTKLAVYALANLFLYSIAMFTLPFVAFYGMQHILTEYLHVTGFQTTVWSVVAAVIVVNTIIGAYVYKAYHEKEYDDDGVEIDQHAYPSAPSVRKDLNLKED